MISYVTGSGTLLGNSIAKLLLKKNFTVYCGYRKSLPHNLKKNKKAKICKFDLKKKFNLKKKINFLVHCAGAIPNNNLSSRQYFKINVLGFKRILENKIVLKCNKIVLISTISVYGNINSKFLTESNSTKKKISNYARSKLQMENLLINFCKGKNIKYLILRLPAIVNANSKKNFISDLISKINSNQIITITNPNFKFNNLIHVKDIAQIVYNFLISENKNLIHNVSTKYPIKLKNICILLKKLLKKNTKLVFEKTNKKTKRIKLNKNFLKKFNVMTTKKTLELICKEILTKSYFNYV